MDIHNQDPMDGETADVTGSLRHYMRAILRKAFFHYVWSKTSSAKKVMEF